VGSDIARGERDEASRAAISRGRQNEGGGVKANKFGISKIVVRRVKC